MKRGKSYYCRKVDANESATYKAMRPSCEINYGSCHTSSFFFAHAQHVLELDHIVPPIRPNACDVVSAYPSKSKMLREPWLQHIHVSCTLDRETI